MLARSAMLASCALVVGCVGPEISHPAAVSRPDAALPVALVVDDLSVPQVVLDDGAPATDARRDLFVDAINDTVDRDLGGEARRVVPELEVSRRPSSLPSVEVQYRIAGYDEQLDPYPPEAIALLVGGLLSFGISALPLGQIRRGRTHAAYVEMRVYDVRAAHFEVRNDAATGEAHDAYDVSAAPLVFRRRYWVEMRTTTSAAATPTGLNEDRFLRAEGAELGHRIVDASLADLTRAIEDVLDTEPIGTEPPPPSPPPVRMST